MDKVLVDAEQWEFLLSYLGILRYCTFDGELSEEILSTFENQWQAIRNDDSRLPSYVKG